MKCRKYNVTSYLNLFGFTKHRFGDDATRSTLITFRIES
jgi:hypothetical protein